MPPRGRGEPVAEAKVVVAVHRRERSDVRRREAAEGMLQVARVGELHEVAEHEDQVDPCLAEPRERCVDAPVELLGLEGVDPARARRLELAVEIAEDAEPHAQRAHRGQALPELARHRRSAGEGKTRVPGRAEGRAVDDRDPRVDELLRREPAEVEPEERRRGRQRGTEDRMVDDGGVGGVPVAAVALGDLVQPGLRAVERSRRRTLGDVADPDHVPLQLPEAPLDHGRLRSDEADPPGGHGETLAEAPDEDHVRRAPGARELAVVDAALVRLIGHHGQAVARGEHEQLVDLRSRRQPAVGVVRVRQDEHPRPRCHRALDRVRIPARNRGEGAARALDQAGEEVARRRHDHLVAGVEQGAEHQAERVHGAVRDQELPLRIGRRRQRACDRVAQLELTAARRRHRVLVERGRDRVAHVRRQRRRDASLQREHVPAGERSLDCDRRHLVAPHRRTPPARAPVGAPSAQARSPATQTPATPSARSNGCSYVAVSM